jgi:hypothetical protein
MKPLGQTIKELLSTWNFPVSQSWFLSPVDWYLPVVGLFTSFLCLDSGESWNFLKYWTDKNYLKSQAGKLAKWDECSLTVQP